MDDLLNGKIEGESLAIIVSFVLGTKVLEVELWIGNGADLVCFGLDEVSGKRMIGQLPTSS